MKLRGGGGICTILLPSAGLLATVLCSKTQQDKKNTLASSEHRSYAAGKLKGICLLFNNSAQQHSGLRNDDSSICLIPIHQACKGDYSGWAMNYESEHETKHCFLRGATAARKECSSSQHKRKRLESHMLKVQMLRFKGYYGV